MVTSDWVAARPLWVTEETEEIEGRSVETSAPGRVLGAPRYIRQACGYPNMYVYMYV